MIYHLDVGAMYPNIILTNRLQVIKKIIGIEVGKLVINIFEKVAVLHCLVFF